MEGRVRRQVSVTALNEKAFSSPTLRHPIPQGNPSMEVCLVTVSLFRQSDNNIGAPFSWKWFRIGDPCGIDGARRFLKSGTLDDLFQFFVDEKNPGSTLVLLSSPSSFSVILVSF